MKNFTLSIALMLMVLGAFAQKITRGPEIGEIYFLGPTATVMYDAIYRSTDFGVTAVCVDSVSALSNTIEAIVADKTSGSLYFGTMLEELYYSDNFGQTGSWVFRQGDIYPRLLGGNIEGHIFEHIEKHSEDYGNNFITHSVNGFFGFLVDAEIDNQNNYGYALLKKWGIYDTLYLMITTNNFQSIEKQNIFVKNENPLDFFSRGVEDGEVFTFIENPNCMIRYSYNYGYSWITKNQLYFNNYATVDFTGGRQNGEFYFLVTYLQLMGQIKHVFIYHSLDYGETFTVYHPFGYGPNPFYVAFEADNNTGFVPLTIQFNDESSGEDLSWEWDFENDGIIDSYEQNPTFIYTDTGYYDVKLTVTNPYNQYSLLKEVFIHVKDTITSFTEDILQEVKIFPNPLNDKLRIEIPKTSPESRIFIYNLIGEIIFETEMYQNTFEINFTNCPKGIYIICIKDHRKSINYKIIKK